MAKPLKITLIVVGVVFALLLGTAIALPLLFDPNDYREKIQTAVKDSTGREFTFGDIKLKVFPWVSVRIAEAKLGNAAGFGEAPFAQLAEAKVGVKLMPLLLDKRIEVSTVTLHGLLLNLAKDKAGKDNWSDLSKPKEEELKKPEDGTAFDMSTLNISGVDVKDAMLSYADAQTGKSYKVENLNLTTGELAAGKPLDFKLALAVLSAAPEMKADIELESTLDANMDAQLFKLAALKLDVKATGPDLKADVALNGDSVLDLKSQKLNVDGLKLKLNAELKDMKTDAELSGTVAGDLGTQIFDVRGLRLAGNAAGKSIPGDQQKLALSGDLNFDAKQGAMKFANAVLQAAGLTINTELTGVGLMGEEPKISGPIKLQKFNPRELMTKLGMTAPETTDPNVLKEMAFSADFAGGKKSATLSNMNLKLDQTTASGTVNIRDFATQAIDFAFKVDQLDADRYMAPKKETVKDAPVKDGKKQDINAIALPSDTLNKLNAQGTLDVGLLKLSGIKLSNAQVKLVGGKGQVKNQTISAKLYGGSINFNHRYTPGTKPQFLTTTQLSALNAAPFLQDFLGKDFVSGLANFNLQAGGAGLKVGDLLQTLNGETGFKVENGAVKGFNLGSVLRKGKAMIAGNLNYSEKEAKQTDFAALTGSAKIVNGIIKADTLNAATPLFRLTGAGEIDLIHQTINYLAKPTIVETSSGEGGKDLADLRGITIPIKLTGSLFAPSYKLDIQEALKQKALGKVNEKLEENKGEMKQKLNNEINRGLNKLFKQRAPAATPAPAPAEAPPAEQPPKT